ncbi:MAG: hypothetical protein ACO3GK_02590 [Bacteroidia bacterium]
MKKAILSLLSLAAAAAASAQSDSSFLSPTLQASINHHASRYVFAPSAYPVPMGGFYYQTYDFATHDVQVGLTENFSLGMGYALPLFAYITPKWSTEVSEKVRFALGDLGATSMFLPQENAIRMNIAYGTFTVGTPQSNASLGIGYFSNNWSDNSSFIVNGGGMERVTDNIYLVGELWYNQSPLTLKTTQSTWVLDANGQPIVNNGYYEVTYKDLSLETKQRLLFGSLQFRIIGTQENTRSWSFGLAGLSLSRDQKTFKNQSEWGSEYESSIGAINTFLFLPSITYIKKFGDLSGFN